MAKSSDEFFLYDVFLSFRGDGGTRYGFTDHLFTALREKGIHTFRDDKELKIGAEIGPSLLKAIRNSRMLIVVLCQNYASSTWCLNELAEIVDCYDNKGTHVLIVFYKVEPSHVWELKNAYADAMAEHEIRFREDSKEVRKWRKALSRVRDLTRVHCSEDMYESVLIEKIVKDILAKLPAVPFQTKYLLGLDSQLEQVKALLDSNGDVCMLGIYGAGGIGKTTFALALYNKIRHQFQASSFLENVREKSNRSNGMEVLQKTLLSEMGEETQTMMGSTFAGNSEIKGRLGGKRVLLILDDVDAVKQLESLAGGFDWFGSGSRVIITTRDADILHNQIIKYKMKELNYHESHELFCWHAFNMGKPAENYAHVSSRAVKYSQGIPLALKVIGSNMKGRSVEEWEIELQKYRNFPDAEIQGVLEISYNSLSDLDQKNFLDIACFFKGERLDYVQKILDSHDFIRVFVSKCLITVDENGCLEMHDLIQDMGREIVRKESPSNPGDRSRLWSHKEIIEVLQENSGSTKIEGMMLHPPNQEELNHWTNTSFEKMKNLRILIVRNTTFLSGPSYLPNSLRLLNWKGYPSKSFPSNFYPRRIVDFKLPHSSLILTKPFQIFEDLAFINFNQCKSITQIPNLFGAKQLRVLTVDKCPKLVRFDESIGFLPNLAYLSASGCTMLKSFVPRMDMPSLKVLSFNFCKEFEHFPHVVKKMDKPLKIHMVNTAIKEFPDSIANLIGLEYIDMSDCKGLKYLSSSFLSLPNLATLRLDGCSQLGESFKRFKRHSVANGCRNLMTLHLSEVNLSYEDLTAILENFPKLEDLNISHNGFVTLPKCIKGSLHLKCLDVSFCPNLIEIPELPTSIQKVDARHCGSLTSEASHILWSKVSANTQRIQIVMPMLKGDIPGWFDCISTHEIPLLWARKKFPIVVLALVFPEVKERVTFPGFEDVEGSYGFMHWHTVSLHLFINNQEICCRDYRHFTVGGDHVLLCDLRVLFGDDEWQVLDASFGDDWKVIQVQYHSDMILSKWGVYVHKQETNMDDIQFRLPNPNSTRDHMPLSLLVPKVSEDYRVRYLMENLNPRDVFNEYLPWLESEECTLKVKLFLRILREVKAEIRDKTSASVYGASLKQEQDECADVVVQVLEIMMENIPKHFVDSHPAEMQMSNLFWEIMSRTWVGKLGITLEIVLEYTDTGGNTCRRFWGILDIRVGDPLFKAVYRRTSRLSWEFWSSNEASSSGYGFENPQLTTVLLKCYCPASSSGYEESFQEGYSPELEELLRRIEQDAMSLNKSYGKMKASIVRGPKSFSPNYEWETIFLEKQQTLGRLTMFGSLFKFKKTPYGVIRVDDDPFRTLKKCFWYPMWVLYFLSKCLFLIIGWVILLLYLITLGIIRRLFALNWRLIIVILVAKYIGQLVRFYGIYMFLCGGSDLCLYSCLQREYLLYQIQIAFRYG